MHYILLLNIEKVKKYKIPHSYFNVVEDIRIDKKMKIKYPDLRKSYYNGYQELVEKDFFSVKDKDVNGLRFIDRLNIYSKSGTDQQIIFNDQEQEFVNRSKNLNTWNDVVNLVKDIYAYSENEDFDKELEKEMKQEISGDQGDQEEEEQSQQSERLSDNDEQQEQNQKTTSSSESDNDKQEDEQSSAGSDSKEEEEKEEENKKGSISSGSEGGYNVGENEALTDIANEQNKKSMAKTNKDIKDNLYLQLPKCKDAVVYYNMFLKKLKV